MKRWTVSAALALLAAVLAAPTRAEEQRWLHVNVQEEGEDGARIELNLPIDLVHKAVPLVESSTGQGRIEIGDEGFDSRELKELLRELERSPDGVYVKVDDRGDRVRVSRRGTLLLIQVEETGGSGSRVDARIPMRIVSALASGEGDELNVTAALEALAESADGELITVSDDDGRTQVRIWVDARDEQS